MGCFSFKCQGCSTPINSTSHDGELCKLFLLKDGRVIQEMEGDYDSYGRVFDGLSRTSSIRWRDPTPEIPLDEYWQKTDGGASNPDNHGYWLRVCELMSEYSDSFNGIAAYHVKCYKGIPPTERSQPDPDQGWGKLRKKYMRKWVLADLPDGLCGHRLMK